MTISDILEHWACIYKDIAHNPESKRLGDQRFFRIRYIDLENTFERNYNVIKSPCMLQSVISTGNIKSAKQAEVTHQIWFLAKLKDTAESLGRFDGIKLEQTANHLTGICEDLISYLIEVKRTQTCPITGKSFKTDTQLASELAALDITSFSYGVMPDIYKGKWLIAGIDWRATKPLYTFSCNKSQKYSTTSVPDASATVSDASPSGSTATVPDASATVPDASPSGSTTTVPDASPSGSSTTVPDASPSGSTAISD